MHAPGVERVGLGDGDLAARHERAVGVTAGAGLRQVGAADRRGGVAVRPDGVELAVAVAAGRGFRVALRERHAVHAAVVVLARSRVARGARRGAGPGRGTHVVRAVAAGAARPARRCRGARVHALPDRARLRGVARAAPHRRELRLVRDGRYAAVAVHARSLRVRRGRECPEVHGERAGAPRAAARQRPVRVARHAHVVGDDLGARADEAERDQECGREARVPGARPPGTRPSMGAAGGPASADVEDAASGLHTDPDWGVWTDRDTPQTQRADHTAFPQSGAGAGCPPASSAGAPAGIRRAPSTCGVPIQ